MTGHTLVYPVLELQTCIQLLEVSRAVRLVPRAVPIPSEDSHLWKKIEFFCVLSCCEYQSTEAEDEALSEMKVLCVPRHLAQAHAWRWLTRGGEGEEKVQGPFC